MKRFLALLLLAVFISGCSAQEKQGIPARDALLPDSYVGGLLGSPAKQAGGTRDDEAGLIRWAWEEADGTPKCLVVEIRFEPGDCDALYNAAQAGAGAVPIATPAEAVGCYDGRAAHVRYGPYYIRIATLGVKDERSIAELISAKLVRELMPQQ